MSSKSNLARNNKARGRGLQQEIRDLILKNFPQLEPDDCRSTIMGGSGEDIQLSPWARKTLGGIQIECKRVKSLKTIYKWYEQAKQHGSHQPVVFFRADREKSLAIVDAEYYLEILKQLNSGDKQ